MNTVKEVRFCLNSKTPAEFVYRVYNDVRSLGRKYHEYFVVINNGEKCLFPPKKLTNEQLSMSVEDYKNHGRSEWFNFVKLSDHVKARKLLNE